MNNWAKRDLILVLFRSVSETQGSKQGSSGWKDFSGGPTAAHVHQFTCDLTKEHLLGSILHSYQEHLLGQTLGSCVYPSIQEGWSILTAGLSVAKPVHLLVPSQVPPAPWSSPWHSWWLVLSNPLTNLVLSSLLTLQHLLVEVKGLGCKWRKWTLWLKEKISS